MFVKMNYVNGNAVKNQFYSLKFKFSKPSIIPMFYILSLWIASTLNSQK